MSKAQEKAEAAIAKYREVYEQANGKPAPVMEYEGGWVLVSCTSERMRFPTRKRRADIEWMTSNLEFRLRRQNHTTE